MHIIYLLLYFDQIEIPSKRKGSETSLLYLITNMFLGSSFNMKWKYPISIGTMKFVLESSHEMFKENNCLIMIEWNSFTQPLSKKEYQHFTCYTAVQLKLKIHLFKCLSMHIIQFHNLILKSDIEKFSGSEIVNNV